MLGAVLRLRDRYSIGYQPGYILTYLSNSPILKNQVWYLTMVLKEPAQEPSFFAYSFMKTTHSLKVFFFLKLARTDGSLILREIVEESKLTVL
jgi:hypothetical protein